MNDHNQAVYRTLKRVSQFGSNHAASFPPGSKAVAGFARVDSLLGEIVPSDQQSGVPASSATGAKAARFEELWADLKAISRTARSIALTEPGFATDFRLGDERQRDMIATTTRILANLQDPATVAKFIAFDLPANFVTELAADLQAVSGHDGEQNDDYLDAVGDTAKLRDQLKEGRQLIKTLDTSVTNRFRQNPEVLAQWLTASHIERSARPETKPANTPPVSPVPTPA